MHYGPANGAKVDIICSIRRSTTGAERMFRDSTLIVKHPVHNLSALSTQSESKLSNHGAKTVAAAGYGWCGSIGWQSFTNLQSVLAVGISCNS